MKTLQKSLQGKLSGNDPEILCEGYLEAGKVEWYDMPRKLGEITCKQCVDGKIYSCILNDSSENAHRRVAFCVEYNCPAVRAMRKTVFTGFAMPDWLQLGFPQSHAGKHIRNYNFRNEKALKMCQEFIFKPEWCLWFFGGETGAGKTHLAQGLAIQNWYTRKQLPRFVAHSEIYYQFREAAKTGDEGKTMHKYTEMEFLVLDDLGTVGGTEFDQGIIYDLLARRVAAGKKTIVTTNMNLDQVAAMYGERLRQRISNHGKWQNFQKHTETA